MIESGAPVSSHPASETTRSPGNVVRTKSSSSTRALGIVRLPAETDPMDHCNGGVVPARCSHAGPNVDSVRQFGQVCGRHGQYDDILRPALRLFGRLGYQTVPVRTDPDDALLVDGDKFARMFPDIGREQRPLQFVRKLTFEIV
jgi:hypothetical protein